MPTVIPPVIDRYFHDHPMIKAMINNGNRWPANPKVVREFTPGKGWQPAEWNKRVSFNHIRKLQRKGVTAVAVIVPGPDTPGPADFTIKEILNDK